MPKIKRSGRDSATGTRPYRGASSTALSPTVMPRQRVEQLDAQRYTQRKNPVGTVVHGFHGEPQDQATVETPADHQAKAEQTDKHKIAQHAEETAARGHRQSFIRVPASRRAKPTKTNAAIDPSSAPSVLANKSSTSNTR